MKSDLVYSLSFIWYSIQVNLVSVLACWQVQDQLGQVWFGLVPGLSGRASEWLDSLQVQGLVELDLQNFSAFDDLNVPHAALKRRASGQAKLPQSGYKRERERQMKGVNGWDCG